jgi:long-chain acyl-CoA synthetase
LLAGWALAQGRRARRAQRAGEQLSPVASLMYRVADAAVLSKVRALFGDRLVMALVGAAPIAADLIDFFDACGVLLLEGYGMTESCSSATLNPASDPRGGTVGRSLRGCEVRIAADGEVLLRGPQVFSGYFRDEDATAAVLDGDGWLHTGDLGSLDADGYLELTGRKKDIIITSSGKNVTPSNIESALRETRWVGEAVVFGDGRPYLVCLLTLDGDEASKLAERFGLPPDMRVLAADERVRAILRADVDAVNERFARIEQIKRFAILDRELTQEDGDLTPTLKVKRVNVYDKFAEVFNRLYGA